MLKRVKLVSLVVIAALAVSAANADIIAKASFEDNTLGALDGQAGGVGFQGTWDAQASDGTDGAAYSTVVGKTMSYSGTNFTVNGGSKAVQYSVTGTNVEMAAVRQLSSTLSAGSGSDDVVYYRFMMNYAANGGVEGDDRCFVSFTKDRDKNGNPWWNMLRAGSHLKSGPDWALQTDGASNQFGNESFSPNATDVHMVVVKLFKHETRTSFSRYIAYIDPQSKTTEGGIYSSTTIGGYYPDGINWVGLLGRTLDTGDTYYVDDVVVATTWQEAVTGAAIPEPATIALLCFGGVSIIARRKRA